MKNGFIIMMALMLMTSCSSPQGDTANQSQASAQASTQVTTVKDYQKLDIPLKKDKFIQINIVVGDIYQAAKAWAALLCRQSARSRGFRLWGAAY